MDDSESWRRRGQKDFTREALVRRLAALQLSALAHVSVSGLHLDCHKVCKIGMKSLPAACKVMSDITRDECEESDDLNPRFVTTKPRSVQRIDDLLKSWSILC